MSKEITEKAQQIIDKYKGDPTSLIAILLDYQEAFSYLPREALAEVSKSMEIPLPRVYSIATFFKAFSLKQKGKYLIQVCMGTACHVRGAPKFLDEVLGQLKVQPGETTDDGEFTVETVNCLGACALGPVVVLNGKYYKHMTAGKLRILIQETKSSVNANPKKKNER